MNIGFDFGDDSFNFPKVETHYEKISFDASHVNLNLI